ncbi:MAG: peptide ABC transporter substrate-binding protein [Phycisphaerales bacterium]|nr:peptide ABC transporter substrate-binding protein [Phycisphaerales bacterium]
MIRTLTILLLLPAALMLGWLAFGSREPRADFVIAAEEPRTIDPHRASWLNELQIADALFEGLTRLNAESLQPEPATAESWSISGDRLSYRFTIRENARWSNGDPVVAEHFRFAWLRALDPAVECQYATMLFAINGAAAYYASRANADPADDLPATSVAIRADDDRHIEIALAHSTPYILDLLAFPTFFPVHPPTIQRFAYRDGVVLRQTRHLWTRPGNIVCNGPYVLTDWKFKSRLLLSRNEQYHDLARVGLKTVEVYITADPNVALRGYESGRVDFVRDLPANVAQTLFAEARAGRRRDFHVGDRFATYFYRVNCRRPPLDNAAFRQALSLALDRDELCARVTRMGETPALTYVPRGSLSRMLRKSADGTPLAYHPPEGFGAGWSKARRIEEARSLLASTGFDPQSRPIEMMFAPNPAYQRVAEAMAAMWETNLGLRVVLRTIEGKVLSERVRALDYDLVRSDWSGDFLDPLTFLEMFTSQSGQNRTGWSNTAYDAAIAGAVSEGGDVRRFALFSEAERILCEDELPILPLYFRRGNYLLSARFTGITDNIREHFPIAAIRYAE